MTWRAFDQGASVGLSGSESGVIVMDEEHDDGARITLEEHRTHAPFAITCGVYGWMFHTRFFSDRAEAEQQFHEMKDALGGILSTIQTAGEDFDSSAAQTSALIGKFVKEYP